MAAELVIAPEAEQDLAEAYAWYEARRIGLGEEFLGSVDACIQAVRRVPEAHAVVHENYRRAWCGGSRTPFSTSMLRRP